MSRTLSQVIGVLTAVRQKDNDMGTELKKKVQSETLTTGLSKVYTPDADPDEEGARGILTARQPNSYKAVAVRVEDALKEAMEYSVPAMDAVATNDKTNQVASADIVVNGTPLARDVPISHLLWLEKYLGEWRKFIALLPTLDPTKNWTLDDGVYKSDTVKQGSFVKEVVPLVLHPGTDKHPPQVQAIEKSVHVGEYANTSLSGAVYDSRKKELLDRADLLIRAVKDAAARANQTLAIEVREGEAILGFLLA
jgi:hypothetical protein